MKTRLFVCAALFCLSPLTLASNGTVSFSGRIVDPACTAHMPTTQQLQLDACPDSAKGATVALTSLSDGGTVALHNGKRLAQAHSLSARNPGTGGFGFAENFRLEGPLTGEYMVVVTYP